jgi:hypothetical protein
MPAHHNFTTQTTRQKRLAHGNNAVAYFFCHSSGQVDPKHLFASSAIGNASKPLGPSRGKVSLHFEHLETPVP